MLTRFVFALAVVGVTAGPAQAASIVVTTTADVMATDGLCSLREAIRSANQNNIIPAVPGECASGDAVPAIDVITFAGPGVYVLTIPGRGENGAALGDLDIAESLTIAGTASLNVPITIDAQGIDRVFHVLRSAAATLTGPLRIRGGHTTGEGGSEDGGLGGGILNDGRLVLDGVEVTGNIASCEDRGRGCESYGGGIASLIDDAPPTTIHHSLVWDNLVTCSGDACRARGGGIAHGTNVMIVNDSQVLSNKASCTAQLCVSGGGGIFALGPLTLGGYDEVTGNEVECDGFACTSRGGGLEARTALEIQPSGFLTPLTLIDRNSAVCVDDGCHAGGGGIFLGGDAEPDAALTMVAQVSKNQVACAFGTLICVAAGGGIHNAFGSMSITASVIAGNLSVCANPECDTHGGGIFNDTNLNVLIDNSTLRHNDTTCATALCRAGGGGMDTEGTGDVSIERSTFDSNHASCHAPASRFKCVAHGAGLLISDHSSADIRRSTFFANSTVCAHDNCDGHGGAVYLVDNVGAVIENSTFSHNSATRGGAVYNLGSITVSFGTFADNAAELGSGLYLKSPLVNTVMNSVLANSPGANCDSDGNVPFVASGTNLSSDGSCGGFNLHNANPKLGVLGYYGGLTKTRPLLAGSPAIDAAPICTNAFGTPVAIDQRNVPRPDGAHCDLGAFEGVLSVSFTTLFELIEQFGAQQQVSLGALLRATADRLTDRNPANDGAGCRQLDAVIHQVGALEKRQELTPDQASELQLAAMNLQASYGCGSLPARH